MKRFSLVATVLLATLNLNAQDDYILNINDSVFEITIDQAYNLTIDGKPIRIIIGVKDTLTYTDTFYSFKYPKDFKISKTQFDGGIEQIMIITAEGSGFLIQKYTTMNPTMMNGIMLNEVTKESINYGFEEDRQDYERVLKSGQTVNVNKSVLTYKDEINIYEIASLGNKDEGILIMTMAMITEGIDFESSKGNALINLMWESLIFESK